MLSPMSTKNVVRSSETIMVRFGVLEARGRSWLSWLLPSACHLAGNGRSRCETMSL